MCVSSDHATVYGQSRPLHEATKAGHNGGTADEDTGQGREGEKVGEEDKRLEMRGGRGNEGRGGRKGSGR